MHPATLLYERLTSEAEIQRLIDEEPETLHLDFKERAEPNKPLAKDKETLDIVAKALSGFANSDGGVLVLGVKDEPRELAAMPGLKAAYAAMQEQFSRLVVPPVPGATAKAITTALDANSGYLVILVPGSEEGPHQAQKRPKQYYLRSGESFRPMEHFELEMQFGRPPRPMLRMQAMFRLVTDSNPRIEGAVYLLNEGRSIARDPMVAITRLGSDLRLPSVKPHVPVFNIPPGGPLAALPEFWSTMHVYPKHLIKCFRVTQPVLSTDLVIPEPALLIEARLFADNTRPTSRRLQLTRKQYEDIVGDAGVSPQVVRVDDEPG